ncbi:tetratricopeptide repeat protein [Candidatus Daviesbacteria bacterium]|nr:tetratricopeptide repeat protein [Candidatus Daviesbacteria bacterium]
MIKRNWLVLLFLSILVIITYANSVNNVFLSDDLAEIVNNPNIGNFSNSITTHPTGFIRPLLYWVTFKIGGLNPVLFRLINIFFHTGSVFLIYALFKHLYFKKLAIFAAGLFAVHPAISEAVVWVSGGSYPQYTFFFLLSFLLYLLSAKRKLFYILSIISYLLSFMSHPQMPLALFLIFPLWELIFGNIKKNWLKALPFLIISMFYILNSLIALPERETTLQSVHYQEKGMDNPFLLIPIALTSYFELTLFPKILTLYHSELSFGRVEFAIRFLITLAFFAGILISFKKNKFIFFWSSFFFIALSPTLTPFRLNWIAAERYLYLPIIGILALAGLGFDKLSRIPKLKQTTYIIFIAVLIILSARTIIRNIDWANEDNLWIATGKTSPSSPNTHNNLGDVYGRKGDKIGALKEFQKAIELKPNYGDAYHNLANTYLELSQPDKALENYNKALEFNPGLWQSYQNIAAIYFQQKNYDLTIQNLQKAIQINPGNLNLRNNLGIIFLSLGQKDKAREVFTSVLNIDPNNRTATQGTIEAGKP